MVIKTCPRQLITALSKQLPEIATKHGVQIVDPQALEVTEVTALSEADAVLYVDIQHSLKALADPAQELCQSLAF